MPLVQWVVSWPLSVPSFLSLLNQHMIMGPFDRWRILRSRGPGTRNSMGASATVRPNACQLGRWKPPAGSEAEPRSQTHFGNNILKIG